MFCGKCGGNIEDGALSCPNCGVALEEKTVKLNEEKAADVKKETSNQAKAQATVKNGTAKKPANANKKKVKKEPTPEEKAKKKKLIKGLIIAGVSAVVVMITVLTLIIVGIVSLLNPANKVIDYMDSGLYDYAVEYYEDDMDGEANKKLIKELDKRLDYIWEYYQENPDYFDTATNEFDAMYAMNIPEIAEKLDDVSTKVNNLQCSRVALEDANYELQEENYGRAILYFARVIESDPNYATAQSEIARLTPIYKEELFATLEVDFANGYYDYVCEELAFAKESLPNDSEISQVAADYEAAIVKKADELFASKKYDEAIEVLELALKGDSENATLTAKHESLVAVTPISTYDLVVCTNYKNYSFLDAEITDTKNNKFNGGYLMKAGKDSEKTARVEFVLEKEYSKFTAVFAENGMTADGVKFDIEISVDDVVVKTIKDFGKGSENEVVEIDIADAEFLKIEVKTNAEDEKNYVYVLEPYVTK